MMDRLMQHGIGIDGIGAIKSLQKVLYDFNSVDTEVTIPIEKVDVNKSIIRLKLFHTGSQTRYIAIAGSIGVDGLSFTLSKSISGVAATVYAEVIEFKNVKSKQIGITVGSGVNIDLPISPVNQLKSLIFESFISFLSDTSNRDFLNVVRLGSDSTLKLISRNGNTIYWQLIEFM